MNGGRMVGAIAGGLVAGLGITAMLMGAERRSGLASELAELKRTSTRRLHLPAHAGLPDAREQAVIQGGHLLLSAAAGAVYAATVDEEAGVLASGVGFGLAFYAAMHWLAGPALGVKEPEWREYAGTIRMHAANHVAFGLATAAGAKLASR